MFIGGFGVVRVCKYVKPLHNDDIEFEEESTSSRGSEISKGSKKAAAKNKPNKNDDGELNCKAKTEFIKDTKLDYVRPSSPRESNFLSLSMAMGPNR